MENYQLNPLLFLSENVIPGISNKLARRFVKDNSWWSGSNFAKADYLKRIGSQGAKNLKTSKNLDIASNVAKNVLGKKGNASYLKSLSKQAKNRAVSNIALGKGAAAMIRNRIAR